MHEVTFRPKNNFKSATVCIALPESRPDFNQATKLVDLSVKFQGKIDQVVTLRTEGI